MSKIINLLKQAEEQRYVAKQAKVHALWIVILIMSVIVLVLFWFDFKLFKMSELYSSQIKEYASQVKEYASQLKENAAQTDKVSGKLARIEEILDGYSREVNVSNSFTKKLGETLDSIKLKIKDTREKISELEKITNSQSVLITTLTNTKDSLSDKIGLLKAEIDNFKQEIKEKTNL